MPHLATPTYPQPMVSNDHLETEHQNVLYICIHRHFRNLIKCENKFRKNIIAKRGKSRIKCRKMSATIQFNASKKRHCGVCRKRTQYNCPNREEKSHRVNLKKVINSSIGSRRKMPLLSVMHIVRGANAFISRVSTLFRLLREKKSSIDEKEGEKLSIFSSQDVNA